VDKDHLAQVLQNLVINASQAMPEGGTITVSAVNAANAELGAAAIQHPRDGPVVKITVADEGDGIPEDSLSKIFDPYFSSKEKGQGLGLATSHSIITKHGGQIAVQSRIGTGTTFTVTLPSADPADAQSETKPSPIKTGIGRVLVMDDDAMIASMLARVLKKLGYECEATADGAQALASYKKALESGNPFGAVIMDLTIPGGMGGREAVVKLKSLDPKAKAIVSSGYSNDPIMSECEKYGFVDVLAKPYRIADVSAVLSKVMGSTT
jgi:CheY-like chemotaxis protein